MTTESENADELREVHDTSWIDHAVQGGHMNDISREAKERKYCINCNRSVDAEDYDWKFIGVGGFLTGPFCGRSCQFGWLSEGDCDE